MNMFSNLSREGAEEVNDRLGGFSVLETDVYTGTIKVAYAGQSQGGARNVTLVVDLGNREYRETIYVTNKKGENFYLNQNKKKVLLPGFVTVDDICLVATGAELSEQPTEDKMVQIWDNDAKKELPKSVPVLVDLLGKTVTLAIQKSIENKSEADGNGGYRAIADTREVNNIEKAFDTDSKLTVVEAKNGSDATYHDAWIAKNKGQTRDKREIKDGAAGGVQSGRPAGAPPQAGQSGAPKKSLFGNKAA